MKKILTLALLLLGGITGASAQTANFNLITQPCNNDGVLQIVTTGIALPVTYQFYSTSGTVLGAPNTTGILNGYSGGPVYVIGTSGASGSFYWTYGGSPPFHYNVSINYAVCPLPSTATATISGGTAPYNIEWFTASATPTLAGTGATVPLPTGEYTVKITDAAGCVYGTGPSPDSIFIQNNSGMTIATSSTVASCTNGTVSVTGVTGGTGPYSYQWSNGANTQNISGLTTGVYQVTVTSAQGCIERKSVNVAQNPQISVNVTPTPATCIQNNGAAIAFGGGGTPPYTYAWSNGQSGASIAGLAGDLFYSVTATDAAGCSGTRSAYVSSTTPINATYTATASSCTAATGSATVSATGGTAPYTITWNTFPVQTGTSATALAPGTYSFTVTDAAGCARRGTAVVPPVSVINAGLTLTNATCTQANGAATVNVSSGASPYTYLWSNGSTAATATNLIAGSYNVQITDNNGCKVNKSASIFANSPINTGLNVTQASCIYTADGAVAATVSGGTAPYTYAWSNGQSGASMINLASGDYYLNVSDAAGCRSSKHVFVPYNPAGTSCYCTITGTVYQDLNNNCTKDAGEPGINNVMIHASGLGYAYTNAAGVYSFKAPTGTYTLSEQVQTTYPLAACQNNAQQVTVTAAAGCTSTANFANVVNPIHDLTVQAISFNGPPVPGNAYYQRIVVGNNGTIAETPLVGYGSDGQLSSPVFVQNSYSTNGGFNYRSNGSFGTVNAGQYEQSYFTYAVPTNIPLGTTIAFHDTVASSAPMSGWLTDYTPWNNVNAYTATVVGSFDPNNKEVSPKGTGTTGGITTRDSVLFYTIHFQNTGTYPAQKVVLVDTLSSNVQIASVKVGASSHNYKASISETGVLNFTFDNINLPDSGSNLPGSQGFVTYTVRQKVNLAVGTQIKNSAAIFFDYNKPVITNTTLNTIIPTLGIGQVANTGKLGMRVYPNPASNQVAIAIESASDRGTAGIRFVNLVGQVVLQQEVAIHRGNNVFEAATGTLAPGLYFVEVSDGINSNTAKLSIVR